MIKINSLIDKIFPLGYTVVFLHAHPDDESFLTAGLINELIIRGRKCIILFGAAAIIEDEIKTIIRQDEAICAAKVLQADTPLFLKFCELKYSEDIALPLVKQNIQDISKEIWKSLFKNNINGPFILVSYDINGGYGNVEHKIINLVGRDFYKRYVSSVKALFEITISREKINKWLEGARNRINNKSLPKISYWSDEFGLSTREINYYYELKREQITLKRKSLAAHKSQNIFSEFPLSLGEKDFNEVFGQEFLKIINDN